jgi:isopropylmalate/homocitrate/citramalate synthase
MAINTLWPSVQKIDSINIDNINYSLITSVSESFQIKNTKKTLNDTKIEILNIIKETTNYIKLYISCINYCPIEGKINNDFIINEILYYSKLNIDNICISDTCGSLSFIDFEYILNKCIEFNIDINKLSLHLHINYSNIDNIKKILFFAFEKGITQYDVSMMETGGCSLTMNNTELKSNLSYELYYKFLVDYIIYKSK